MPGPEQTGRAVFGRAGLDRLVTVLAEHGYRVIGPTVRDNVNRT